MLIYWTFLLKNDKINAFVVGKIMKNQDNNTIFRNITMITQISLYVMVPIFLCLGLGIWLDRQFGWSTTIFMLILGMVSGARTGYVTVKDMIERDEAKRKKRLNEEIERKVSKYGKN